VEVPPHPIRAELCPLTRRRDELKYPSRRFNFKNTNLGLPSLPPRRTFGYYVTAGWAFEMLCKGYHKQLALTPLQRAAVLERVEIF
jgi:hypothetical protein